MAQAKIYRLSKPLVILGYLLVIPSVLVLAGVVLIGLLAVGGSAAAANSQHGSAMSNAVVQLQNINGLPAGYIELFKTNQIEARNQVSTLPDSVREKANAVIVNYSANQIAGAAVTGFAALGTGVIMVVAFVICIPLLIVGLLLVLKRKVWRCASCGWFFNRA